MHSVSWWRGKMLDGTEEIDHFYLDGRPKMRSDEPAPGAAKG